MAGCLCRLEDVSGHLRDRGLEDERGNLRPAVELEGRLRREAADHAAQLGMNPTARARLGLDVARGRDLAMEWAEESDAERAP